MPAQIDPNHKDSVPPPSKVEDHSVGDPDVNPAYQPLPETPGTANTPVTPDSVPARKESPRLPPDR